MPSRPGSRTGVEGPASRLSHARPTRRTRHAGRPLGGPGLETPAKSTRVEVWPDAATTRGRGSTSGVAAGWMPRPATAEPLCAPARPIARRPRDAGRDGAEHRKRADRTSRRARRMDAQAGGEHRKRAHLDVRERGAQSPTKAATARRAAKKRTNAGRPLRRSSRPRVCAATCRAAQCRMALPCQGNRTRPATRLSSPNPPGRPPDAGTPDAGPGPRKRPESRPRPPATRSSSRSPRSIVPSRAIWPPALGSPVARTR
jgi:hypothetical protein